MLDDGGRISLLLLQFSLIDLHQHAGRVHICSLDVAGHQEPAAGRGRHIQWTHGQPVQMLVEGRRRRGDR